MHYSMSVLQIRFFLWSAVLPIYCVGAAYAAVAPTVLAMLCLPLPSLNFQSLLQRATCMMLALFHVLSCRLASS
jgi:hypothetical protein